MSAQPEPTIDVYDKTRLVRPTTASSDQLPGPVECFTNGKSFFLSEATVAQLAEALPDRLVTTDSGWAESIEGGGTRPLGERHINGARYFKFRKTWGLQDDA